jgi:hypothetical protein
VRVVDQLWTVTEELGATLTVAPLASVTWIVACVDVFVIVTVDPPPTEMLPPSPVTVAVLLDPMLTRSSFSNPRIAPTNPVLVRTVVTAVAVPPLGSIVALPWLLPSLTTVTPSVLVCCAPGATFSARLVPTPPRCWAG